MKRSRTRSVSSTMSASTDLSESTATTPSGASTLLATTTRTSTTTTTTTTKSIHHKIESLRKKQQLRLRSLTDDIKETQKRVEAIPTHQRWRIQERNQLKRRILSLQESVLNLKHRHQQELMTAMEMEERRRGHNGQQPPHLNAIERTGTMPVSLNKIEYTVCVDCGHLLEKMVDASVMICPACGEEEPYLETTRDGLAFNEDVEFVNSYQKKNHLQEWINTVQGRETAPIPEAVIDAIKKKLYDMGIRRTCDITRNKLYEALKKLKLRRFYKNQTSIISQLTGLKPKRILSHEEEQINLMFGVLQKVYEKHIPPGRTNFLSYSYVLYKLCELLGMVWIRPYFKLLKGDGVLHKQDAVWKKICVDLGWKFIPSI